RRPRRLPPRCAGGWTRGGSTYIHEGGRSVRAIRNSVICAAVMTLGMAWAAEKPNVVVIITDDVGYGDIGAFIGGDLRGAPTPHLNRMAAEGTKLTSFYAQPFCTPTRASFVTGRLPIRAGFTLPLFPGLPMGLHPDEITIAELLE